MTDRQQHSPCIKGITQDFVWGNNLLHHHRTLPTKALPQDNDCNIDIASPEDSALFIAKPVRAELIARETALRATELRGF